jgi:hypothetical protein
MQLVSRFATVYFPYDHMSLSINRVTGLQKSQLIISNVNVLDYFLLY